MTTRKASLLLAVIVLAGMGLRCHGLSTRTFWFDEAFSDRLIHDFSWSEMIDRTGRDVHPPLFYVALRLWADVLGDGMVTLRFFSVLMAGATIIGVYGLVVEAFSHGRDRFEPERARLAGLTAAALLATSTLHIFWSQEARMYTMATALLVWSSWLLLRALRVNRLRWYVGYALTAAALMYTHNYGLFSALAQGLFAIGYLLVKSRRGSLNGRFPRMAIALAAAGAIYLPWLPVLLRQRQRVAEEYWISQITWWSLPDACQELVFPVNAGAVPDHLLSIVVTCVAIAIVAYLAWRPNAGRGLLLALVLVPVGASVAVSLLSVPIVNSRYYLFAYIAALCGLAGLLCRFEPRHVGVAFTGLLVVGGVFYTHYFYHDELQVDSRPGIKGAVEYVTRHMRDDEPVVVTHPCIYYSVRRYLRGKTTPILYLPRGRISHYMGGPIFRPADACGKAALQQLDRSAIWVMDTTGYTLNWRTEPLPAVWREDSESLREFPEIMFFQGVVRVYRCERRNHARVPTGTP